MRTRDQDARDHDVTATDCHACGTEGHTGRGGGQIHRWQCESASVEVCETCMEEFHQLNGYEQPDSDTLDRHGFNELMSYVNEERRERDGEQFPIPFPPVNVMDEVAREFARILKEWLNQTEWAALLVASPKDREGICSSHDCCDANVAMDRAMRRAAGIGNPCSFHEKATDKERDYANEIWGNAWALAKRQNFYAL